MPKAGFNNIPLCYGLTGTQEKNMVCTGLKSIYDNNGII